MQILSVADFVLLRVHFRLMLWLAFSYYWRLKTWWVANPWLVLPHHPMWYTVFPPFPLASCSILHHTENTDPCLESQQWIYLNPSSVKIKKTFIKTFLWTHVMEEISSVCLWTNHQHISHPHQPLPHSTKCPNLHTLYSNTINVL